MLQKLFNPEWQITSKLFLLSRSFLIGFSFSLTAEISRLELEFEESLPQKTASIFKEGIGHESNGAANQEKQIFLLCQISPSASSTRDLGTRLANHTMRGLRYPRLILERLGFPPVLTQTLQVLASSYLPQKIFNFS